MGRLDSLEDRVCSHAFGEKLVGGFHGEGHAKLEGGIHGESHAISFHGESHAIGFHGGSHVKLGELSMVGAM